MQKSSILLASTMLAAPAIVHQAAYANNLTGLIPDIFTAFDVVSREMVGFIPSASRASNAERAALNQSVVYQIVPEATTRDTVAQMTPTTPPDVELGNGSIIISKSKESSFAYTGEEQRGLNTGPGYIGVQAQHISQALRALTNEVEADGAIEASLNASRAFGIAGTAPFEDDLKATAQVRKILDDNGAPATGRSLVMNTSAGANLRGLRDNLNVEKAGTSMTLRQGMLLDINGFMLKETGQGQTHVAGDAANATTNAAGYSEGDTEIVIAAAGTGEIKRGDAVSFAGDPNLYMVAVGNADVSGGGQITIAEPGLRQDIAGAATAITVSDTYDANVAFSPDALHMVSRAPALPQEGDAAIDRMSLVDPRSGISYEFSVYAGQRMVKYEVALAWGWKLNKSAHTALLLG